MAVYKALQGGSFLGKRYRDGDILDTQKVTVPEERTVPKWFKLIQADPVQEVVKKPIEDNVIVIENKEVEVKAQEVEVKAQEVEVKAQFVEKTKEELVAMGAKDISELYFATFGEKIKIGGKSNEDVAQMFLDRQNEIVPAVKI